MTLYRIRASGCDDVTDVTMELDETEAAIVRRVAKSITDASEYGCMPVLEIKPTDDSEDDS